MSARAGEKPFHGVRKEKDILRILPFIPASVRKKKPLGKYKRRAKKEEEDYMKHICMQRNSKDKSCELLHTIKDAKFHVLKLIQRITFKETLRHTL